jgi:DNA-binding CsgD family transcriptional regulator
METESLSEIIERRSTPGILIVDLKNKLHYSNSEALEMIPDLQKASRGKSQKIPAEISSLCDELKRGKQGGAGDPGTVFHCAIWKGETRPPYSMRAFFIGRNEDEKVTHIMVLIEKIAEKHDIDFQKVGKDFKLSARELEVLKLLCEGLANKEISARLFISEYTAKDHVKNIMRKIKVASRSQIVPTLRS